jgi:hypothetical protein
MPQRLVLIQWDTPDEKGWLSSANVQLALSTMCPSANVKVYDESEIAQSDYWKDEVRRLARFLREYYPADVERNMTEPFRKSSAVDLAIDLLENPRKTQEKYG